MDIARDYTLAHTYYAFTYPKKRPRTSSYTCGGRFMFIQLSLFSNAFHSDLPHKN